MSMKIDEYAIAYAQSLPNSQTVILPLEFEFNDKNWF